MLTVRCAKDAEGTAWSRVHPEQVLPGLFEDTDYLLDTGNRRDARVFVDDVEVSREGGAFFRWRPCFYAGRVNVDVVLPGELRAERYFLDVSPTAEKSGQAQFDEMVADIRATNASLLLGPSAATMQFGRRVDDGPYAADILLARIREHGPFFLGAVEAIARAPHRSLVVESRMLPLARIRRLHPDALRDRRLAAIASGHGLSAEEMDALQFSSFTSAPTFDTPANRALLSLLKRFRATLKVLRGKVEQLALGGPPEEQKTRIQRRREALDSLDQRTFRLLIESMFAEVSSSGASAAGLTQIAAQPLYSQAYRLGCQALANAVDDSESGDALHVPPSWGIYEVWCYLMVVRTVAQMLGTPGTEGHQSRTATVDCANTFSLPNGATLEVLLQATFPALKPRSEQLAWSISRERRPDIVLVLREQGSIHWFVFDAKWRHGRQAVLEAMESAHVYHDALRVGSTVPDGCLLLLPGEPCVPNLEGDAYIGAHAVGAVSGVRVDGPGADRVRHLLQAWLAARNHPIAARLRWPDLRTRTPSPGVQ